MKNELFIYKIVNGILENLVKSIHYVTLIFIPFLYSAIIDSPSGYVIVA